MNICFVAGPAEPEEAACERHAAYDCWWQTPFWDSNAVVRLQFSVVVALSVDDVSTGKNHAEYHSKIGKPANAWIEMVNLLEDDRVGGEEEV